MQLYMFRLSFEICKVGKGFEKLIVANDAVIIENEYAEWEQVVFVETAQQRLC